MSSPNESSGNSNNLPQHGITSKSHTASMEETPDTPMSVSSTDEAQVIGASGSNPEEHETHFSNSSDPSVAINEVEMAEHLHDTEPEQTEHSEGEEVDSDSESSMDEFGLKYDEESDTMGEPNDRSDEAPEYLVPGEDLSQPMRARNRSGPPIPPPVPVRPGQLFFSNQIWTRLNVEQQLKLGALKVGSKNKSFKTRPWLVVQRSNRVDADGQQMLWVMCCTTRNRHGWEGVSYRDSKSFIPMAPTPSRFGRPVLPLVTDERDVFLGGSLLFLEVFKEIKPGLLGDYIGYISDESVSIVNREQMRIAEERRRKEEYRAAHTSTYKPRKGGNRRGGVRYRHGAEASFDHCGTRPNEPSGAQSSREGWVAPNPILPFQLPPPTNTTHVSPPLNPRAPPFCDPNHEGYRESRRGSFSSNGAQNRPQHHQVRQNYPNINQAGDHGNHSPQSYGSHGYYGSHGGYSSPGIHGGHDYHGNRGPRYRSSSSSPRSYTGIHQSYTGQQIQYTGYPSNSGYHSVHTRSPVLERNRSASFGASAHSYQGGIIRNGGRTSGGLAHAGAGWTAPRRDQRH
ncbi:hypothetical protein HOY82DRAFT_666901 [Tuber indicum]|nr:hypothetical protein HOY82DRAFT_666901 [Tuber indicum]